MQLKTYLAAAAASAAAAISGAQMDLTTLPPEPATCKQQIESASLTLAQCAEIAEEKTGGTAASIEMLFAADPPQAFVMLYSETERHEVTINANNGAVLKHKTAGRFPGWSLGGKELESTDSGLMYCIVEEGKGAKPADATSKVEVHYTGYLVDGSKFDSSVDRGRTAEFGLNQVIRGWTEGVGMMREGEKRKLVIPAKLGYGARGAGGSIPPNAMLVFDVELIRVVTNPAE